MKDFPLEYIYVDSDGELYLKRPCEKKIITDVNPYTLASIPVVFNEDVTVQHLYNIVEKYNFLAGITFYAKEFLEESKKPSKAKDVEGYLRFYWMPTDISDESYDISCPKMEVDGINKKGEAYGIEFLGANDIKHLKIKVDPRKVIVDQSNGKYDVLKSQEVYPTLFHIIYGLFWEMSFFGDPKRRDEEGEKLRQSVNEIMTELHSTDELMTELEKDDN